MNDKELLELAAKAGGAEVTGYQGKTPLYGMPNETEEGTEYEKWNPLESDGDALRLVVKLGLSIRPLSDSGSCRVETPSGWSRREAGYETTDEATRRAIVRAAAEIGKGMK